MVKNPCGKPLRYKTPDEMEAVINQYFDDLGGSQPTVTGLCLALGIDRMTLLRYETLETRLKYRDAIKKAKLMIHEHLESMLYDNSRKNVAGVIFSLKNNFGWRDQVEIKERKIIEHKHGLTPELENLIKAVNGIPVKSAQAILEEKAGEKENLRHVEGFTLDLP